MDQSERTVKGKAHTMQPHVEHRMTNIGAFINLIKASVGTGCLEMPMAFCNSGYVTGLIGTYVVGLILVYSLTLLIQSMQVLVNRYPTTNYSYAPCLGAAISNGPHCLRKFSPFAAFSVNLFMILYHFGVCCIYILFIADNLKLVGDEYFNIGGFQLYVIALTTPLVLLFLIRNLKTLVPLSMLANILLFISYFFMLFYMLDDLPSLSERKMFNTWRQFPLFFGTIMFSMESVGVIIAIEQKMATPERYLGITGILTMSSLLVLTLYALFGFCGYWRFGCESGGNIAFKISANPIASQVLDLSLAFSIYISYAMQGYVIIDVLWNEYLKERFDEDTRFIMELNTRCLIVLCTVFVAAVSPDISIFLPFLGSFCLSSLTIIFPSIMDLCIHYSDNYGPYKIFLVRDIFLLLFGVLSTAAGTWAALLELNAEFEENTTSLLYKGNS